MVAWKVIAVLAALWLLPGVLTDLVLLAFIAKQFLFDRRSSAPRDDAKLLLVGLLLGFILLPLLIAAPLSGYLSRRQGD
jgi:MFS family permease